MNTQSTLERQAIKAARDAAQFRTAEQILDHMAYVGMCVISREERGETELAAKGKAEFAELARLYVKRAGSPERRQ